MGTKQQRVDEELVEDINDYPGERFSERLRNWAEEEYGGAGADGPSIDEIVDAVDKATHGIDDVRTVVRDEIEAAQRG